MGERFDGFFRFRFLNVAKYRVDDKDKHNDDGVERQYFAAFRAWRSVGFFDEPCDERDAGGSEQQVDEGVFELRQDCLLYTSQTEQRRESQSFCLLAHSRCRSAAPHRSA